MHGLKTFIGKVESFSRELRREGFEPLSVSQPYDLFPHIGPPVIVCPYKWPETWPNSERAGVYGIFDAGCQLLYVGKTSMNSFLGARLNAYFGYEPDRTCGIKDPWNVQPRFVITIGVPDTMRWEAPSLEEFLIQQLNPPLNKHGRSL